jgi:hypothetical protein
MKIADLFLKKFVFTPFFKKTQKTPKCFFENSKMKIANLFLKKIVFTPFLEKTQKNS